MQYIVILQLCIGLSHLDSHRYLTFLSGVKKTVLEQWNYPDL